MLALDSSKFISTINPDDLKNWGTCIKSPVPLLSEKVRERLEVLVSWKETLQQAHDLMIRLRKFSSFFDGNFP